MDLLSRTLSSLVCATALIGGASAADVAVDDLRFGVGFSLTQDTDLSTSTGSADYDSDTLAFGLQYMRSIKPIESWGGLIYGGELFYSMNSGEVVGTDIDINTFGLQGYFGYAFALANLPIHFEGTPFLGVGYANTELSAGSDSLDEDDFLIQYGLRVAGYYTFANRWQAGLDLRYLINSVTEPTFNAGGGDQKVELETSGFMAVLQVGYRF